MDSTENTAGSPQWVSPFGNLRVNRLFTANRSLSQCPTSFIGTWRQGIHRKLLVASPRDAENLILFGLHQKDQYLFGCQGSISLSCTALLVLAPFFLVLTGDRYAPLLSSTRISCQLLFTDNATRLIAGSRNTPKRSELKNLIFLQDRKLQTF